METKIMELKAIRQYLRDGIVLALGGQSINMNPTGLIREVLRAGCKRLYLVASPVGGLAADLLIGAGAVETVEFAQMGLWEYGLAPNMRRFAQEGKITCREHT